MITTLAYGFQMRPADRLEGLLETQKACCVKMGQTGAEDFKVPTASQIEAACSEQGISSFVTTAECFVPLYCEIADLTKNFNSDSPQKIVELSAQMSKCPEDKNAIGATCLETVLGIKK